MALDRSDQQQMPALTSRYAEFKVVGNASVHLSGYYMPEHDEGMCPQQMPLALL